MDSYRVRMNGTHLGDFETFEAAEAAVERVPPRRYSVASILGADRQRLYGADFECDDKGHTVLAWRVAHETKLQKGNP